MSTSIKTPDENPSNVESILSDTIGLPGYTINPPGSRIETLLIMMNGAFASSIVASIDENFVMTITLKNNKGETIGTTQTIDLPLESVIVSGSYDSTNKKLILVLENGNTIEVPIGDLISGLQEEITVDNKLSADLVDDATATHKFATAAEKTKLDGLAEIKSIGTGLNLDDNGELTATDSGTTNYNDLSNKPQINGNTLSGNKTSAQLGLASASDIPTVPITAIQKNGTGITPVSGTVNITVPTTAADVSALPDTTKYATALSLTINSSTFVMTGQLKDQNGDNLGTAQTIDLPLESVVVGGSYNSQTKKVVLTLQNGNTIEFSVADLVSGLQTELSASNKLNPEFINYDSTHRAVSDTEKSTWNGKQNALSSEQLNAVNSKMTRKQAITNGVYLVEEIPMAVTHPSTGNPYIHVSFSGYIYNVDSVTGATVTRYGIIYCNDGTATRDELRIENVDGVHIIKFDDVTSYNLAVSGTNPVNAVGFAQYQDADGVTSDVLYTKNLGGDYRLLNAPSDIADKISASDYATQNTGGTVRVWTTTSGGETTLHIANEAPTP